MEIAGTFQSRLEARALTELLEEEDIPYMVKADDCGGVMPNSSIFFAVYVLVGEEDLARAREVWPEE